jgi:uncharacterized membrane protein YkgB
MIYFQDYQFIVIYVGNLKVVLFQINSIFALHHNLCNIYDRFISYVTIDTESDSKSETTPSTAKQWDLANKLVEVKAIGMQDVTIDDKSYIMATLPKCRP